MPFIQINTSSKSLVKNYSLEKEISKMVADQTGKPENYVMTMIKSNSQMTFAGSHEPWLYKTKVNWITKTLFDEQVFMRINCIQN